MRPLSIKCILLLSALVTARLPAMCAETPEPAVRVEADDKEHAARHFGNSRKLRMDNLERRHLDGVKGYSIHYTTEGPGLDQPEQLLQAIGSLACRATVFGLVQLEGATAFVGKDDIGVFTKLKFRVMDDWRADKRAGPLVVHLIVPGGEVVHAGEMVRVDNPHANYKVNSSYILVGQAGAEAGEDETLYGPPPLLEVKDNVIYPGPGWTPFAPGTSVQQAKDQVANAVSIRGCL